MLGQQKGLGQGGINGSRGVSGPGLEILHFEASKQERFLLLISRMKKAFDNPVTSAPEL
jgi:hypothetical protein